MGWDGDIFDRFRDKIAKAYSLCMIEESTAVDLLDMLFGYPRKEGN